MLSKTGSRKLNDMDRANVSLQLLVISVIWMIKERLANSVQLSTIST